MKEKKLAPKTINIILTVGSVAFGWLTDRGEISTNPSSGLRKFAGESKKRDILTAEKVQQLFSVKWIDERSRVGNLLSMATGMRASEVVALQPADIKENHLMIRHSWSFADALKKPKNGEERVVPLLPEVREELINLLMLQDDPENQRRVRRLPGTYLLPRRRLSQEKERSSGRNLDRHHRPFASPRASTRSGSSVLAHRKQRLQASVPSVWHQTVLLQRSSAILYLTPTVLSGGHDLR